MFVFLKTNILKTNIRGRTSEDEHPERFVSVRDEYVFLK
jgi:hypothetical protein